MVSVPDYRILCAYEVFAMTQRVEDFMESLAILAQIFKVQQQQVTTTVDQSLSSAPSNQMPDSDQQAFARELDKLIEQRFITRQ